MEEIVWNYLVIISNSRFLIAPIHFDAISLSVFIVPSEEVLKFHLQEETMVSMCRYYVQWLIRLYLHIDYNMLSLNTSIVLLILDYVGNKLM